MIRRFLKAAALAAIPVSSVCVFAPLVIFSGNPGEFTASFVEVQARYVPYLVGLTAVLGIVGALLPGPAASRYLSVLCAASVLLWLQGNILVWDYGVFDGRSIDWMASAWRGVLDTMIWITVLAVAYVAHRRIGRHLVQAAVIVFAVQVVAAGFSLATNNATALAASKVEANREAREAIFRFSATSNVVQIVMDGFQSDIFEQILDDPANGDFKEQLRGFTLFRDNLGVYPYTQMTVPALLSGRLYRNEIPVDDFVNSALAGTTILGAAEDAGFEVDIATPVGLRDTYARSPHTNAYGISRSGHVSAQDYVVNDSAKLLDLSLFRVMPHFAKALVHRDELWVFQARVRSEAYLQMQYFSDLAFLRELTREMRADREAPVFKIMHLMLSHRPTVGNQHCEYDGRHPTNRVTVTKQASCGLKEVLSLLARMKEQGIYDDSMIILMADHGAWVPVEGFGAPSDGDVIDSMSVAMATPLLAVKRPGDRDNYRVSNAPTSLLDLPATIAAELSLGVRFPGHPVFDIEATQKRERVHFTYGYGVNKQYDGYLLPMHEFIVSDSPFQRSSWRRGQRYLPEGKVMEVNEVE